MFTGIVEHVGTIEGVERGEQGATLRVSFRSPKEIAAALKVGDSIAVNGCCLTVAARDAEIFAVDLSDETLHRTSFGEKRPGQRVNLERPLAAGTPLGGHFVQGHVDGVGWIARNKFEGRNGWLAVRVPGPLGRYVAEKGSLAVDGISLTVAAWREGVAEFAIIPFTWEHTNLRELTPGDAVNIECDILAKYVERLLEAHRGLAPSRLTVEELTRQGF